MQVVETANKKLPEKKSFYKPISMTYDTCRTNQHFINMEGSRWHVGKEIGSLKGCMDDSMQRKDTTDKSRCMISAILNVYIYIFKRSSTIKIGVERVNQVSKLTRIEVNNIVDVADNCVQNVEQILRLSPCT